MTIVEEGSIAQTVAAAPLTPRSVVKPSGVKPLPSGAAKSLAKNPEVENMWSQVIRREWLLSISAKHLVSIGEHTVSSLREYKR
jgi:hypothetical protein